MVLMGALGTPAAASTAVQWSEGCVVKLRSSSTRSRSRWATRWVLVGELGLQGQLGAPDRSAQVGELGVGSGADHDRTVGGGEWPVGGDVRVLVPGRRRCGAADQVVGGLVGEERQTAFEQRYLDVGCGSSWVASMPDQGRQRSMRSVETGDDVDDGYADLGRVLVVGSVDRHHPRSSLDHRIKARLRTERTERRGSADRHPHRVRALRAELLEPECLGLVREEVLDHDVGASRQAAHLRRPVNG